VAREVYIAAVGLTKVDLTGRIFQSVFDLFGEAYHRATSIMSKTIDPVERQFGFTMPALIALVTQAWLGERRLRGKAVADLLGRLMVRAHALGADNPLAAFHQRPEPLEAYFDTTKNLPVAMPLMRKDCSPICDGAACVILTARPQAVRVAGLGSATETSSILDRTHLACLDATRAAAKVAYWRANIARPRDVEGLYVECHDAFNSLLPIDLADLGLVEPEEAIEAVVGSLKREPGNPLDHPVTGVRGRLPVNLSGGLKARGHPVGGTGLFQIAECYLQLTERFPNPRAQVANARVGLAHSIGGPGNNVYVTLIERSDSKRKPDAALPRPAVSFRSSSAPRITEAPEQLAGLHGASALLEAYTSIYVTSGHHPGPIHVGLVRIGNRRAFAKLDHPPGEGEPDEAVLTGQKVKLLVKDDGDQYFQITRGRGFDLSGLVERVMSRVGGLRKQEE
jgi:hypothetical protein